MIFQGYKKEKVSEDTFKSIHYNSELLPITEILLVKHCHFFEKRCTGYDWQDFCCKVTFCIIHVHNYDTVGFQRIPSAKSQKGVYRIMSFTQK